MSGTQPAWAVTGDYAFVAAGHLGLIEALNRGIPLKVLIMHNGQALTTGGQPVSAAVFRRLLSGYAEFVSTIDDPSDPMAIRSVLQTAQQSDRPAIIVVEHV